ncbi:hypothetical protein Misp01_70690 [Microtetraspora sp. NBRC 13810]|uniref:hypothetical protein n=1 Tax=Microtetraspora sp. NBRC 13810 TaxID=3030990 RepID=UPI0024A28BA8|nr:hypothetical protein [Microtetraspora sp. NBRC 13810]GLW11941.1 hypothetical protein Misp01_70690 [Microtetraspora sp. NBRC 13810]
MSIARSTIVLLSSAVLLLGAGAVAGSAALANEQVAEAEATIRVAAGSTTPGQGWVAYGANGIYIDVDTSSGRFSGTPVYTSSVGGDGTQWGLVGTSAIYSPTATGFRVYVQWNNLTALTPAHAAQFRWYVNWIGVDNP